MHLDEMTSKLAALVFGAFPILLAGWAAGGADRPTRGTPSREYFEARELFEKLWIPDQASEPAATASGRSSTSGRASAATTRAGPAARGATRRTSPSSRRSPALDRSTGNGGPSSRGNSKTSTPASGTGPASSCTGTPTSAAEETRLAKIRSYAFVQTRDDLFALAQSQRSTPALFGAGRIDAIPDKALLAAETRSSRPSPRSRGGSAGFATAGSASSAGRARRRASKISSWPPARTSSAWRSPATTSRASRRPRISTRRNSPST